MNCLEDCFIGMTKLVPETGCLLYTGYIQNTGYGRITYEGRREGAHRVAYALKHGPIPAGMSVCHTCDVRLCVNPDHLFLGTQTDNMKDMFRKGRNFPPPHTEESHRKNSVAHTGRSMHPNTRAGILKANTGSKRTPEQRERMSRSMRGIRWTDERRLAKSIEQKAYQQRKKAGQ